MPSKLNDVIGELHFELPYKPSKVVTKDNAAVMLEIVGLMRSMATLYETSGIPTCKHIREQANQLETIAKKMLEEC